MRFIQRDCAIIPCAGYEDLPPGCFAQGARVYYIEYVMTKEDKEADDADGRRCGFQAYQQSEQDHAATDGPYYLEDDEVVKGI